jgi:hypothetical protein
MTTTGANDRDRNGRKKENQSPEQACRGPTIEPGAGRTKAIFMQNNL